MTENPSKEPENKEESEQKPKRRSIRIDEQQWKTRRPGKADGIEGEGNRENVIEGNKD